MRMEHIAYASYKGVVCVPKIKICGITDEWEAEYLNEAGADYAGFVFYGKSRRNISIDRALAVAGRLDLRVLKVAVVVSPTAQFVRGIQAAGFDILQVHGEFCKEARREARIPVWRAVNIRNISALEEFFREEQKQDKRCIRGYVADGGSYGAGRVFDWEATGGKLHAYAAGKQLLLAGGLAEENVQQGIMRIHPDVVDVSSGVEEDGRKSREKIKRFIRKVREHGQ